MNAPSQLQGYAKTAVRETQRQQRAACLLQLSLAHLGPKCTQKLRPEACVLPTGTYVAAKVAMRPRHMQALLSRTHRDDQKV